MRDDMASNKDIDVGTWVERRLAILDSDREWAPNVDAGLRRFSAVSKGAPQWIRTAIWASALVGTICLCLLLWAPTRVFARGCVNACLAQASIAGKILRDRIPGNRASKDELTPLRIRRTATDFAERDQWGETVQLSALRGHIVVLNFWATWCAPCRKEIPSLNELQAKYRDSGLVVLGVSLDDGGWKSVRPFLKNTAMFYRVVSNPVMASRSYSDVTVVPMTFLIDRHGQVAVRHPGLINQDVVAAEIAELLQEK